MEKKAGRAKKATWRAKEAEHPKLLMCRACDQQDHRGSEDWHLCTGKSYHACRWPLETSSTIAFPSLLSKSTDHTLSSRYDTVRSRYKRIV